MNRRELALVLLLRLGGLLLLTALIPAVMPFSWMQAIHRFLGMGELPAGPIMDYLTRSLCAMYAMHGGVVLFASFRVRERLPVIKCLGVLAILFGGGMIVLDVLAGMPWPWTVCEGPSIMAIGVATVWLAQRVRAETRPVHP